MLEPELRFPEFSGHPVQYLHLADATTESTERNGSGQATAQIMGVSKVEGIVPMEERIVAADTARYKFVRKDWFAYNPMRLNIGSIARWQGDDDVLVSPDYVVFKCKSSGPHRLDPAYLDHFRRTDAWENFVSEKGDGSVRVRIYYKDLARLQLALPSFPEQQRIAKCLDTADALIAAQGRKVETLRAHKKGLMQQLFPQEGETQPRLRFPEFQSMEEWAERPLRAVATINPPNSGIPESFVYIDLGSVVEGRLTAKTEIARVDAPSRAQRLLSEGDIIFQIVRPYQKNNLFCDFGDDHAYVASTGYAQIRAKFSSRFLYQSVHTDTFVSRVVAKCTGSSYPAINASDLAEIGLSLPPTLAEQQRIADCLTALDDLIAAETRKLDTLKTHKKALMQQLFPQVREDEA
ncbi:MAG: restriction endonuclease subunit S [Fuscovulum sp.]|nr:MAG: restriction endonuclease subunit S [Fuscovulum sp.]